MGGDKAKKVGGVNLGADSKGKRLAVAVRYFWPLVCARTNERKQQTEQVNREGTTIVERGGDMVVGVTGVLATAVGIKNITENRGDLSKYLSTKEQQNLKLALSR